MKPQPTIKELVTELGEALEEMTEIHNRKEVIVQDETRARNRLRLIREEIRNYELEIK